MLCCASSCVKTKTRTSRPTSVISRFDRARRLRRLASILDSRISLSVDNVGERSMLEYRLAGEDVMLRVGFIGLGAMGLPMARNVLKSGFPLTVWARRPESTDEIRSEGAGWA